MRHIDKTKLDPEQLEMFEIICKEQKKNIYDVLDRFVKQYNIKYKEDYDNALTKFWEDYEKD